MTAFRIISKKKQVLITETPAGNADNPLAFKIGPKNNQGEQHFMFQLNYVCGDIDLTVEQDYYFQIVGDWSLPKDAESVSGMFANMMWETAQEVEEEVKKRGAQTTHTYNGLLETVEKGLKSMKWP